MKRDLSPTSNRRVEVLNHVMSLPHSNSDTNLLSSENKCTSKAIPSSLLTQYSNLDLKKDWDARDIDQFPKFWGMQNTSQGVLFVYVGDIDGIVTRSIFVKEDMTVEVNTNFNLKIEENNLLL